MKFAAKPWTERVRLIEQVLPDILAALTYKTPTTLVAERVAAALGEAEAGEIATTLLRLGRRHPLATHDGEAIMLYGHERRRWNWNPGDSKGWTFAPSRADKEPKQAAGPQITEDDFSPVLRKLAAQAKEAGDEARFLILKDIGALYWDWRHAADDDSPEDDAPEAFDSMFD